LQPKYPIDSCLHSLACCKLLQWWDSNFCPFESTNNSTNNVSNSNATYFNTFIVPNNSAYCCTNGITNSTSNKLPFTVTNICTVTTFNSRCRVVVQIFQELPSLHSYP
jgi:hypothetical protein